MDRARSALRGAQTQVQSRTAGAMNRAPGGTPGGGGPGQGAIDFGRRMTGNSEIDQVKNQIVSDVASHLASKGIYQDQRGTWQIAGLERNDPSLDIRNSAVNAMGGPSWMKIVNEADARLGANNIGAPSASPLVRTHTGLTPPMPQTTTPGGTPTIPGRASVPPLSRTIPGAGGPVPQPGLGGVPPMTRTVPGAGGPVPSPGLGGVPASPIYNPPKTFPPGGQQVGSTTTPTGSQVSPTQYPTTAPQPGLGGTLGIPPGRGGTVTQTPQLTKTTTSVGGVEPTNGPQTTVGQNGDIWFNPGPGMEVAYQIHPDGRVTAHGTWSGVHDLPPDQAAQVVQQAGVTPQGGQTTQPPYDSTQTITGGTGQQASQFPGGPQTPYPQATPSQPTPGGMPGNAPGGGVAPPRTQFPGGPPTPYPQATPSQPTPGGMPGNAPGGGIAPQTTPGAGGAVPSPGLGGVVPSASGVPGAGGTGPVPSPGLGGVPAPSRPGTTPAPQPGTPPLRPGQMPTTFPNGRPFGGPNPQVQAIQQMVQQRIMAQTQRMGGGTGGMPGMPGAGTNPALAGLAGLGDRIAQSVQGGLAGMRQGQGGMPGQGAIPGQAGSPGQFGTDINSIMQRVQGQLAQQRMPGGRPSFGNGFPFGPGGLQMPGMPGAGQPLPGGTTPGVPPTGQQPGTTTAMPTGTGQLGTMGGRYSSLDQYNPIFEAAGKEFGVPPELLKAMAGVESGWGSVGPDYCRSDGSCGIMQVKGDIWDGTAGCSGQTDVTCNIRTAAAILSQAQQQCGSWDCAITGTYFPSTDVQNGTTQGQYLDAVHQSMQEQAANPGTGQPTTGGPSTTPTGLPTDATINPPGPGNSSTTDPVGQKIADAADQYVGTAYVWGGGLNTPEGPSPGNWDCSGFVKYMSDHYGDGSVPSTGSHEQYQWAASTGRLNSDPSLVQPGDIMFWDSHDGDCNGQDCVGHVSIYIGDGKMIHAAHACSGGDTCSAGSGAACQGVTCGVIESSVQWYYDNYDFYGSSHMY